MLMENFQPLTRNNKVCLVYLQCKLQQDRRSLIQLQVKMPEKSRNKVFGKNKQQTRSHLRYLEGSKLEKRCAWFFQNQRTKPKVNGTFSAVKNKQ